MKWVARLTVLVAVLSLAMTTPAFAYTSNSTQSPAGTSFEGPVTLTFTPSFVAEPGDSGTVYPGVEIVGLNAGDVNWGTLPTGWYVSPTSTYPSGPLRFYHDAGLVAAPLPIQFLTNRSYTVNVALVTSAWASRPAQQTFEFQVAEPAPPVVSTPASSTWSIAVMAVLGLTTALFTRRGTRRASVSN